MNKKLLLTLIFACSILTLTAGSAPDKKGGTTLPPMFLLGNSNGMMQMVYWTNLEEPQKDEDYAEYYDDAHQEWELQERFRHNASKYTKLIVDGIKTRDVKYVDEILLNPDGEQMFPGELHSRPEIPSPGARFTFQGGSNQEDDGVVVVTDSYLATHKALKIKPTSTDRELPMRFAVIKKMEEKYGMKVSRSVECCIIGDRYTYGVLQFEGEYKNSTRKKHDPNEKSALALEIIIDGDKVYSYPVEGWYDPEFGPTWNADDGGEYFPSDIAAAFEGPQGVELCYLHWAPESATTGIMLLNNGNLDRQEYTVYHSLIDEPMPVWKKDIEEMKRLYVAEDPGENENVELTKWAHVFIDYEGEQIWISDNEEENGAFFSREDGKLKLVGTVRPNLKPSFPESRDSKHYLVISGPAGGPSYYTEIFKFQGGKLVESFNALEVYDEIEGCALNGKEVSPEQGKAYMKAVPDAIEPFIFWTDINGQ